MKSGTDCLIALGSNQGDERAHLRFALRALGRLRGTAVRGYSSFQRTSPVGVRNQPDYLNAAAWLRTNLSPMGLLVEFKRLEALRGRRPGPRWGPRPLDLDIIVYGRLRLRSKFLQIPHPRALKRRFVLAPLAQIEAQMLKSSR